MTARIVSWVTPNELGSSTVMYGEAASPSRENAQLYTSHYIRDQRRRRHVGDLPYADNHPLHDHARWGTWARFVELSAAHQPWVLAAGNHELYFAPEAGRAHAVQALRPPPPNAAPRAASSTAPFWYSSGWPPRMSSCSIASYSAYAVHAAVGVAASGAAARRPGRHAVTAPCYNSNAYHYTWSATGEHAAAVRALPARRRQPTSSSSSPATSTRTSAATACPTSPTTSSTAGPPVGNVGASVYVTVGDGGNIDGVADNFTYAPAAELLGVQ
ncbi:unnamed protein product [Miscanthus lutarioriparius]|uniref:Acid phosphatase n=1 Tax=Miscanthus lutarioriparius TaxID=422564 RepID=A0A811RGL3_9POAL|nr:unnamed protein product [Miscanthus lutarioriparius]